MRCTMDACIAPTSSSTPLRGSWQVLEMAHRVRPARVKRRGGEVFSLVDGGTSGALGCVLALPPTTCTGLQRAQPPAAPLVCPAAGPAPTQVVRLRLLQPPQQRGVQLAQQLAQLLLLRRRPGLGGLPLPPRILHKLCESVVGGAEVHGVHAPKVDDQHPGQFLFQTGWRGPEVERQAENGAGTSGRARGRAAAIGSL